MKLYFLPRADAALQSWGQAFVTALNNLKVKYSIPDAEVTEVQNFFSLFSYVLSAQNALKNCKKSLTIFKKIMLNGTDDANPTGVPQPEMGAVPAVLVFDGKKKIQSIANRIKAHTAYSEADGMALGIIGPEQGSAEDPSTWKPHISFIRQGDFVLIQWGFEGHPAESLELQCDRGTGTWNTIVIDPDPDYLDNVSVQTVPNPTTWRYRAIYRKNGVQAGQWSDVLLVAVP